MIDFTSSARLILTSVVLFAWALANVSAGTVTLIENGQAKCTIVVPREDEIILETAEDLQYHLQKMSGAKVPIIHDANKASGIGIYIDAVPLGAAVRGRRVGRNMTWPDGYVIEMIEFDGKTSVALFSTLSEGIVNAVYGLLEDHLGCRWFTPGEIGEHIPKRRTVTLEIPGGIEIVKPDLEKRMPWYNGNANKYLDREGIGHINRWYRRNRHGGPRGKVGHAWNDIYTPEARNRVDADHDGVSDLTPVVDGMRTAKFAGNGLCMSHPKAFEIASEWFTDFFDRNPDYDHWSFSQEDSIKFCGCDVCRVTGSNQGALMLRMSNRVIEKVNEAHPTKRITIMPYEATLEPPEEFIPGNENLIPIIVSMGVDQIQAKPRIPQFRRQVERWMTMLPRAWSRDYVCWSGGPWPLFQSLQQTRDFYISEGYTGVMDEYLSRNLGTDTHMWLSGRTAWDHSQRIEDLLHEFYTTYFGAAAGEMKGVYERIEQHMLSASDVGTAFANLHRLYPADLMDDCLARIVKAKAKVSGNRTILARIERDENCLKATRLWLNFYSILGQANRAGNRSRRSEAAKACQSYLDFVDGLNGTLSFGGGGIRKYTEPLGKGLAGTGTNFTKGRPDESWPGRFVYYDWLDQGGKITDAHSWSRFRIGSHGLYIDPGATGQIIYDVRTTKDLQFKEAFLPGRHTGWDLAINLALPEDGHNGIQVSLDDGRTWVTAFEDIDTSVAVIKFDLTKHVRGTNRFLL
ncbi:MAG: DUF4838 domain-containing protein, partial [Phycisphaerae bacterium]|nr:DUF4838 domain-containing protein [Phycisphaerae bacterium]